MNRPQPIDRQRLMLVPQGEFELERRPRNRQLQAWDAADEFLLGYIDDLKLLAGHDKVLILNDAFGALSVALAGHRVYSWNDSIVGQQALADNLLANGYPATQVECNSGIELPAVEVDCVLIKVPRSLALLEHQLYGLRPILHRDSRIVAAGMARHVHSSTLALFETILGPATTTRARKKSRLILVERDHSIEEGESPYPDYYELEVDRRYRLLNHAGLFSRDRLDRGTRLMLEYLPVDPAYRRIVDLGCGNGVLGIVAASFNPDASLLFCDQSKMAIASAEANFVDAFARTREAEFHLADGLDGIDDGSADLVLLNPPFHQHHGREEGIAHKLFLDARRVLRPGGELRVVGNRHLGYHKILARLFGTCQTLSADSKFVILSTHKPEP